MKPNLRSVRFLLATWGVMFAAYWTFSMLAPWWSVPIVLFTVAPASSIVGHRILFGKRAARHQWLILKFIAANCFNPGAILKRRSR